MEDILELAGEGMMKYRMMVEDGYVSMGKERTQMAITKLLSRLGAMERMNTRRAQTVIKQNNSRYRHKSKTKLLKSCPSGTKSGKVER